MDLGRANRSLNKVKYDKTMQANALDDVAPLIETETIKTRKEILASLEKQSFRLLETLESKLHAMPNVLNITVRLINMI